MLYDVSINAVRRARDVLDVENLGSGLGGYTYA